MPTELTVADHLEGLREAMVAFVRYADRAGPTAAVPTCPGWTVRDLVAHQGMVHRWATALLAGAAAAEIDAPALEREGLAESDPLEWLRDGAVELAHTLATVPEDVEALVFLNDAPAPRAFWARRQCHETTMHAVDALAAALGRMPAAAETWIGTRLAVDGLDELVMGNLTRRRYRLRTEEESVLVVAPRDSEVWWRLTLSPDPVVTTRHTGVVAADDADWELDGPAVALYLQLWNRAVWPDPPLAGWTELAAVTW